MLQDGKSIHFCTYFFVNEGTFSHVIIEFPFVFTLRAFYMKQLPDVDKSVWGWYKEGLMTFDYIN